MRSFAIALIAAALATFTSAAPVDLPGGLSSGSLPSNLASVPSGAGSSTSQLSSVGGETKSVTGTVRARNSPGDVLEQLANKLKGTHFTRATTDSVPVIFDDLETKIQPSTEQLTYINSSNATVAQITAVVASIKGPVLEATSKLQVLIDADVKVDLSVSEIAAIVGVDLRLILGAAGKVLAVVEADTPDIVADVEVILGDLGAAVTTLVADAVKLVHGLTGSLKVQVESVEQVIVELKLTALAHLCGIDV